MMMTDNIKWITARMMDGWVAQAGASERLRTHYNVHQDLSDPVQRLFVAARRQSYFRPHRHPGKSEFAIVVCGLFDVFEFDDSGRITGRTSVGPGAQTLALDIQPGVWHTWLPMADESVFFEVKQGPYDPQSPAEFAPWSPPERTAGVAAFQLRLNAAGVGDCPA
ncbi:MAG: WbuC family cupin fold metalloprotein [Smithellaceae bacterium]